MKPTLYGLTYLGIIRTGVLTKYISIRIDVLTKLKYISIRIDVLTKCISFRIDVLTKYTYISIRIDVLTKNTSYTKYDVEIL